MAKRGQTTLFIILGIVLLIIIGVAVYLIAQSDIELGGELTYPSKVQEVVDHVQACTEDMSTEAVIGIGYSGGYFALPNQSYVDQDLTLPYYNYDGENLVPSDADVQTELEMYVATLVEGCVDLDLFDFDYDVEDVNVECILGQSYVDCGVDYPIVLYTDDGSYDLSEQYSYSVDAPLGNMLTVSRNIVDRDIENPDELDLQFLLDQELSAVKFSYYNDDTLVYILEDDTAFNGEDIYTFMFASYYEISEEFEGTNIEDYLEGLI